MRRFTFLRTTYLCEHVLPEIYFCNITLCHSDDEAQELPSIGDASQLNDESQRVTTIIELESVTRDDAGKYSCIAQNELGEASAPAWLIIEGRVLGQVKGFWRLFVSDLSYFTTARDSFTY